MKVFLIRHAECVGNISNRISGRTDFELTDNGRVQAQKLAQKLKKEKIDIIYSSPLKRAVETAEYIATEKNIDNIHIDNGLIEINYGDCDGLSWDEINYRYPMVWKYWKEIYNYPVFMPNQEEFSEVATKMNETIKKIERDNNEKNICIISHGIAIQSYLCLLYNKPYNKANELPQLKNAEYIEL